MAAVYPGGAGPNTFVPSFEASNRLRFEYSRNPKSFALPRWAAMRSVKKTQGKYLELGASEASRVVSMNDYKWMDGADRPDRNANLESFEFKPYFCERYAFPFHVGRRTADQADWDLVPWMSRVVAQKAMTARTKEAILQATTAGNFTGSTGTATATGGGKWSAADATNRYILATVLNVQQLVHRATQGAVGPGHLTCVIDPIVAAVVRQSPEILDFVKQQANAPAMVEGREFFDKWGIPEYLYGVRFVVDDTVVNTVKKGVTDSKTYALGGDTAIFCTNSMDVNDWRGKVELPPGEDMPSFDTVTLFMYEDMTVETLDDPKNRRIMGSVVDDYDVVVTCPKSGYLVTDVL